MNLNYKWLPIIIFLFALWGCTSKREIQPFPSHTYVMAENGRIEHFKVVSVWTYPPPWAAAPGRNTIALVDSIPTTNNAASLAKIAHLPGFRQLNGDNSLTSAAASISRSFVSSHRVLWIVSDAPVIVAIGVDKSEPLLRLGASLEGVDGIRLTDTEKLIGANDLGKQATDLIILDKWPEKLNWDIDLTNQARFVHFPKPKGLGEIMQMGIPQGSN